jgi:hypothetical protein
VKHHRTIVGPSRGGREVVPSHTRGTLPTAAAIASALALLSATPRAHAVIATNEDGGIADGALDDADAAPDAAYCEPRVEMRLGGAPPITRVHGTGCGCGGHASDDDVSKAMPVVVVVAMLRAAGRPKASRRSDPR